jgi:hypothetical protein
MARLANRRFKVRNQYLVLQTAAFVAALFPAIAVPGQDTVLTSGDSKIVMGQPSTNFGNAGWLHVSNNTDAVFHFNLSAVPGPVTAELQVQVVEGGVRTAGPVAVYQLGGPWSESSVTWAKQPPLGERITSNDVPASADGEVVSFDVSALVNRWLDDPASNHGLSLQQDSASTSIVFRSRESKGGAFPARLVIAQAAAGENFVTVAAEGADYDNPADAADNADAGDGWCNRTLSLRCRILVEAGTYEIDRTIMLLEVDLTGAGRASTVLVAAEDLATVISSADDVASEVADLTIINQQLSPAVSAVAIIGFANASRLDVQVESAGPTTTGLALGWAPAAKRQVNDLDMDVVGAQNAIGVSTPSIDIANSRISVRAAGSATGIISNEDEEDFSPVIVAVTDTQVTAIGGGPTAAISAPIAGVLRSKVAASGPGAVGIRSSVREGPTVRVFDSTVDAGSLGILLDGAFGCAATIDNSTIRGSAAQSTGMRVNKSAANRCEIFISDSEVAGRAIGLHLEYSTDESSVRIDRSTLSGATGLRADDSFIVRIALSRLDGAVQPAAADILCVFSYNGDYQPLGANCLPTE